MTPIYISATVQDSGKTCVSLGLMKLLTERGLDPGYCKPVGQHYVRYQDKNIDEDSVLIHKVFNIQDPAYYLSPIAIERGFTTKFINDPNVEPLEKEILLCKDYLKEHHKTVIIEGTGHAGVGSCFGLSNARVAELVGAKVIIVTGGGVGKPIDEIALNLALFKQQNVEVAGVILNKVLPEKLDKIKKTVSKGLEYLGTKLIGTIPYEHELSFFTVGQIAEEFGYTLFCGHDAVLNRIEHTVVAAMEPQNVLKHIRNKTLVITPGDRIDNILASLIELPRQNSLGGIILTGGFDPHPSVVPLLVSSGIPVLLSKEDTFKVSTRMASIGFKIRSFDTNKISKLHDLVEEHVDVDFILNTMNQ